MMYIFLLFCVLEICFGQKFMPKIHTNLHVLQDTPRGEYNQHAASMRHVLVHLVGGLVPVLDDGCHGRLQPVHFVVGAMRQCHGGRAHGLLAHLALVHVSGALVEIAERGQTRDQRQHVHGVFFHVRHPTAEQDVRVDGGVHHFHPTHGLVENVEKH